MIQFLSKRFIKESTNYTSPLVRQQYGMLCSFISIGCNIVLVLFKITMGIVTNSIAIQADGLNNLSDVGSNVASLFGFKLANKHPDEDHPYGHGRMEYIAGLVIAFLIILVGLQSLKDSVLKVINPEPVTFSTLACFLLVVSILVKFWMFLFNRTIGDKINSSTLHAASRDSLNDMITTFATLLALVASLFTDIPVDGIFGAIVSIVVLKAGYDVFNDTVDPLLGKAPDKELIKEIEEEIMKHDEALGIHDLMMHDYGPGRRFLTLHVEVDCSDDIMSVHDAMDLIERDILKKFHILTTIHMDPIDSNDAVTNELKEMVLGIIKGINEVYTIHDFRVVSGPTHTNLIFDVLIPSTDEIEHRVLKQLINEKVKEENDKLYTVIQIDHSFV